VVLEARVEAGEIGAASRGRSPSDLADFQRMFWTEYSHRLLAALTVVVLAGCLSVALRDPRLRQRVGVPLGLAAALVLLQAAIGAALIGQGTNTHWLFLHQGNAALVVGAVVWALLRLLPDDERQGDRQEVSAWLRVLLPLSLAAAWVQLLLGALVAGSRLLPVIPSAPWWDAGRGWAWNLLDNAALHQALHRAWACLLVVLLIATYLAAARLRDGRLHLALQASATFVGVQVLLGLATLLVGRSGLGADIALPLAHQLIGMCVFTSLAMACFDACQGARPAAVELHDATPAGAGGGR
jgi:cytochrome c oxidase assembly protein subunit 15